MKPYTFISDAIADRAYNRSIGGDFSFLVLSLGKNQQAVRMTTVSDEWSSVSCNYACEYLGIHVVRG
jgi:hypothetical protein